MAAIDKICEYSGNYTGYHMYGFKRNHIQIEPQYRKFFKGKNAILTFEKLDSEVLSCKDYYVLNYSWEKEREYYNEIYFDVPENKIEFEKWMKFHFKRKPTKEYFYSLEIIDEDWNSPANNKIFTNYTYDNPKHVIRRLKRLLGGEKYLTVVFKQE